jgi:hypothetical protein
MRLAFLALASLLLLMGGSASAQGRAPFCSRAILGEGDAIRCNFYSMAACQFDVSGRGGFCIRNPELAYGRYAPRRSHRR